MKINKILMAVMALFVIGMLSLSVFAYKGNPNVKGPNYNEELHEQLEAALEAKNFNSWLKIRQENNLPMKGKIFQVINAENFDKYVELHNAQKNGDIETVSKIRAELGLGQGQMKKMGNGMKGSNYNGNFIDNDGDGICDNFVDNDGDGNCDNIGYCLEKGRN